jgi:hypothetical protein
MKTILFCSALSLIFAAGAFAGESKAPAAPKHDCGNCPMHKKEGAKKCSGMMCPEKIAGVKTTAKPVANGVEVTMTATDKETIAKAQELTLVHYGNKETMDKDCPGRVEGAEAKIENTADGVKVLITGKTPEVIKKIQAASAKEHMKAGCPEKKEDKKTAKAAKKYICPMKCAEADKPGKCPKCGMQMEEKK